MNSRDYRTVRHMLHDPKPRRPLDVDALVFWVCFALLAVWVLFGFARAGHARDCPPPGTDCVTYYDHNTRSTIQVCPDGSCGYTVLRWN